MAHVGVQRFGAGDAKEHAAEHKEALEAAAHQVIEAIERIDRQPDLRMLRDAGETEDRDDDEPAKHDRAEGATDRRRAERLNREERNEDHSRGRQHVGLQRRRDLLNALEGRENGDGGRDRAVAVYQRGAEQADGDDDRPLMFLDTQQGHQRDDAALPVIVHADGDVDVFDGRDEEQGPGDQRKRAENRRRIGMRAGVVEHGLERVERARADVAEHHAERGEAGARQASGWVRLRADHRVRHVVFPTDARVQPSPLIIAE